MVDSLRSPCQKKVRVHYSHFVLRMLTITRPDDWHLHVRDGDMLRAVIGHTAVRNGRAIIMPNLVPPVTTAAMAVAYRERILRALPEGTDFNPLMTLYLTDTTTPEQIAEAKATGVVYACKLYPAGATTNSHSGVTNVRHIYPALQVRSFFADMHPS